MGEFVVSVLQGDSSAQPPNIFVGRVQYEGDVRSVFENAVRQVSQAPYTEKAQAIAKALGSEKLFHLVPKGDVPAMQHMFWHVVGVNVSSARVALRLQPNRPLSDFWQYDSSQTCEQEWLPLMSQQEGLDAPQYLATLQIFWEKTIPHTLTFVDKAKPFLAKLYPTGATVDLTLELQTVGSLVDFYWLSGATSQKVCGPEQLAGPLTTKGRTAICQPVSLLSYMVGCQLSMMRQPADARSEATARPQAKSELRNISNDPVWLHGFHPGQPPQPLPDAYKQHLLS